jgi:hypothetical protein
MRSRGLGFVSSLPSPQTSPLLNSEQLTEADYLAGLPGEGSCFLAVVPFVGELVDGGRACRAVVTIPEPWPLLITVGLGGLLAFSFLRGFTR